MNAWDIYKELKNYTRSDLEKMEVYFNDDGASLSLYPIEYLKVDSEGDLIFHKEDDNEL